MVTHAMICDDILHWCVHLRNFMKHCPIRPYLKMHVCSYIHFEVCGRISFILSLFGWVKQ